MEDNGHQHSRSGEPQRGPASRNETQLDDIEHLVGATPLLQIHYEFGGRRNQLYAKYESENMTGSIKDRMVLQVIRDAYESGQLRPGDLIVEASSGNTGISFAAIGRALGHRVRVYMPNWLSSERVQLIRAFGAEVIPVSHEQGGFVGAVKMARSYAMENTHCFLPSQFENKANIDAHENQTGQEIQRQLACFGKAASAFVAGVGTGGTVMGVGRCLRRANPATLVFPLEPANSPTLRTGTCIGTHRIQGISDEFIPALLNLDELNPVVDVWDGDAILMAQSMSRHLGLAVGISSGANVLGAIKIQHQNPKAVVVTILPDSNKKYLTTDLCREEPVRDDYLTPNVKLCGFRARR